MKTIDVLLPRLPPLACGVGDYALNLSRHWPEEVSFRYWVAEGFSAAKEAGIGALEEVPEGGRGLAEKLSRLGARNLLVHYSAYGFHPRGWPGKLMKELGAWQKKSGGRTVVMLHELWGVWPWWSPQAWLQEGHRRDLIAWLKTVQGVLTNTADHQRRLRKYGVESEWHPVPSNIPPLPHDGPREKGLLALFGLPLARVRALEEHREVLIRLFASGRLEKLLLLGTAADGDLGAREEAAASAMLGADKILRTGRLPADELSRHLSTAEFALSDQTPLSLTKSTVLMAYAAHGLPVLSRFADKNGEAPLCWMVDPAGLEKGESIPVEETGILLKNWYEEKAGWPRLVRHFAGKFEG